MKNLKLILVGIILSAFLYSCDKGNDVTSGNTDPDNITVSENQKKIVESMNKFGIDLFNNLETSEKDNLFYSPFSINSALYMLLNGATNETKAEILNTLKLNGLDTKYINDNYNAIHKILTNNNKSQNIFLANSFWVNNNFNIENSFKQTLVNYYFAVAFKKDFGNPATLDEINDWISDHTGNMIQNMLSEINPQFVLFLINAIYFKDDWKIQFDKEKTTKDYFFNLDNTKSSVEMMYLKDTLKSYADDKIKSVELQYSKSNSRMLIIQPKVTKEITNYIKNFNLTIINDLQSKLKESEITLYMPKMKIKTKYKLNDILVKLGIKKAFSSMAEFGNISKSNINVSEVLHDAALEIDEAGTKAAAATVIIMKDSISDDLIINLNKPFFFFIIDNKTDAILFTGQINKL